MSENLRETIREIRREKIKRSEHKNIKGECRENAEFLKEKLEERGYTVEVIKGGIDYETEPTPKSYDEAKSSGTVHYWVLVKTRSSDFYCDICMEMSSSRDVRKEILCSEELPPHYIKF